MNLLNNTLYNSLINYEPTWWHNKMEQIDASDS